MSLANLTVTTRVCVAGIVRVTAVQTFDPLDISCTLASVGFGLADRLGSSLQVLPDTLVESAILIIVEPCVAIVSACIPTLAPAVRDMTSWSIIEYKKMILRITNTQFEPDRPLSVERATVEELPMFEGMKQPIRPRLGVRYDSLDILFDFSRRLSGEKRDLKSEHARGVQREIDVDAS